MLCPSSLPRAVSHFTLSLRYSHRTNALRPWIPAFAGKTVGCGGTTRGGDGPLPRPCPGFPLLRERRWGSGGAARAHGRGRGGSRLRGNDGGVVGAARVVGGVRAGLPHPDLPPNGKGTRLRLGGGPLVGVPPAGMTGGWEALRQAQGERTRGSAPTTGRGDGDDSAACPGFPRRERRWAGLDVLVEEDGVAVWVLGDEAVGAVGGLVGFTDEGDAFAFELSLQAADVGEGV